MYIPIIIDFLALLTLLSNVFLAGLIIYLLSRRFFKIAVLEIGLEFFRVYALPFALAVALAATFGSLFFSEIAKFPPCELCWFQRVFMYPQAVILAVALIHKDPRVKRYIIPLCLIGGAFSVYQYYFQLFPPALAVCTAATDCTVNFFWHYGYINIVFMSLSASALNFTFMILAKKSSR